METINIHHIGGIGDCGPAEKLQGLNPHWIVYDAKEASLGVTSKPNITYINKCLGDRDGITKFYEFVNPSANSVFPSDSSAKNYEWKAGGISSWGEWTKIEKVSEIPVTKFDTIKNEIPDIDVLSMDCQGSEYLIMKGISDWDGILCVILEVRFTSLYEGEALYPEVKKFLEDKGFKLVDMGPIYYFNEGDKEFATFAEPVFIKDLKKSNLSESKLNKLKQINEVYRK